MKKIVFAVVSLFLSFSVFAQVTESSKANVPAIKTDMKYCCPKCNYCSFEKGTCPHHKKTLEQAEVQTMFCCNNCGWKMEPVKGKCPESTTAVMTAGVLKCVTCYHKDGDCPKCGTKLSPIEISKKKVKKEKKEKKKK